MEQMSQQLSANSSERRARVRHRRHVGHLSLAAVAGQSGVDPSQICRWELSQLNLSVDQVSRIEAAVLTLIATRLDVLREEFAAAEQISV
jgi:transcriptional regulator with XRE-family HTH domain